MMGKTITSFCTRAIVYALVACLLSLQNIADASEDHDDQDDFAPMLEDESIDPICEEPPPPLNGELLCHKHKSKKDVYVCKAECENGYEFPNGKRKGRHTCNFNSGEWKPEYNFPDCQPICSPPCQNGGECIEGNHCVCTPGHRGRRCEFSEELCDPEKGLKVPALCNHTDAETLCVLNCPQGTRYESQPADVYLCSLDGSWSPSSAPKCIPINVIEPPAAHGPFSISKGVAVSSALPNSDVCAIWGNTHVRTFDGGIYSFQGGCSYLLAKDCEQETFAIHVQNAEACESASSCATTLAIYIGSEQYILLNNPEGLAVLNNGDVHTVPVSVNGLLFQMLSSYVTVTTSLGFKLKWNMKNTVLLRATTQLMNRTCGLCGKFDGTALNDFETSDGTITDSVDVFVNSWAMEDLGEKCEQKAIVKDSCSEYKENVSEAEKLCHVVYDDRFSECHQLVNPEPYYEACKMDHCGCLFSNESCYCGSLSEYFRECSRLGGRIAGGWRSDELCPLDCPEGMIYRDCGTSCPKTCKETVYDCEDDHCVDGCHCPEGTVLHHGRCVERHSCPCLHNGQEHQPGEKVLQDCNACECNAGKWECTKEKCEARCSSTGDPHYTTFDGLTYEFLGSCSYYLVYNEEFAIVQDVGPCQDLLGSEPATDSMFCTKSVQVTYKGNSLLLMPGIRVTYNEKDVVLPFSEAGLTASMATDMFLKVSIEMNITVLWDGHNRIYVDAHPSLSGQTAGLCGTFNKNQNDDFLTPDNDIEADVATFASRWQASDSCNKRERRRAAMTPCHSQPQKLKDAIMLCSSINHEVFEACHSELDPEPYVRSCVSDLCACGENLKNCLCPILADYSFACSKKGTIVNWVDEITPCKPVCPGNQVYQECANPCTSSCAAIASSEMCITLCVQGCACEVGMTLNSEGTCVAVDQCPCVYQGKEFPPASVTVQGSKVCTCQSARWTCRPGDLEELISLRNGLDIPGRGSETRKCLSENNEEFTQCVEECPRTCQNMHRPPSCQVGECKPGCRCKEGFILDTEKQKCVEPNQCGCTHQRRRYEEGDTIKQACNLCSCEAGKWRCTEKTCAATCSVWGDSHFKTFDGKMFDFQGECEYILTKGMMKGASFVITIQNVPCGTSGITCSKSFTVDLGPLAITEADFIKMREGEKLTLTKDDPLPRAMYNSRFVVVEAGLFVMIYTDVGVSIQWDRGTRIYVTLDPKWRNRVEGLCGNFDDDQEDDFMTRSGGIPEARASLFAHSWRVQEFCPEPQIMEDICETHPQRKGWAQQKCGILKSDVFSPCHAAVTLEPYYERCIFDACACDMGGDCDCLCTAIAAYAQECSIHGVPIKWRSQDLCPIQCEECATYDSCMPSCPKETCENELRYGSIQRACSADFCVEGCNPKPCPEGQIYNNGREYKCIPESECLVPCIEINGKVYNEGDRITDLDVVDACMSCYCLRGEINCTGDPCSVLGGPKPCRQTGWTPWMNTWSHVGGDLEELQDPRLQATYEAFCGIGNITQIECRATETKQPITETEQRVQCSLPRGLVCEDSRQDGSVCLDYEIRVFCDCGMPETTTVTVTIPPVTLEPVCQQTGWTPWMSGHLPDQDGEFETLERLRFSHYFCAPNQIENIECRATQSWNLVSGNDVNVICNKKLGLMCNGPYCEDYEVRLYCNCGEVTETIPPPRCVTGWTEFFNTDRPSQSDIGDDESLDRIRERYDFCYGGVIVDVQCMTLVGGELVDYSSLDTFGIKCSKNEGLICNKYIRPEECPDYSVRFYCACEPVSPRFLETTTERLTTPTPIPVIPVPVECGWTPWLNTNNPEAGTQAGDVEDLALIQRLYKTCGGKDLKDIECRMSRTQHDYTVSMQKNLRCDTQVGFRCQNEDQVGNCYDYEIRLLCMYDWCIPETPEPTIAEPTTINPCPDGQIFDNCAYNCEQMCSPFRYQMSIQCVEPEVCVPGCRPIAGCEPPNLWRDFLSCVPREECTCLYHDNTTIVAPNDVIDKECERCQCVDSHLSCSGKPGCGLPFVPTNILNEDCWTKWINTDIPSTYGGDFETLSKIRQMYTFCDDPIKIECRTADTKQKPKAVGQTVMCDLNEGLICWNKENKPNKCHDYEIRLFCPCVPTLPPVRTPVPTLPPGPCVFGWTEWYNNHVPDDKGEYETVQYSRIRHYFCANDMISAIECRQVGSDQSRLQSKAKCDLNLGLVCNQIDQGDTEPCWDYEVRFFCDCPTEAPPTVPITLPPVTTTELPIQVLCAYWSEWINEHHPSASTDESVRTSVKGHGGATYGDLEKMSIVKLRRDMKFCQEGFLSDIECREASTDLDYRETDDRKLVCSLTGGFRCKGKDQVNKFCRDYKIRYFCSCITTKPPVITKYTPPFVTVAPCSSYYKLVDGLRPLPDSSLRASSSADSLSGPQNSRLSSTSTEKSAGAWIPKEMNSYQFLEVDLGKIQPVYGVVTKGRNGYEEWVTSYKILYSRNGNAYAYVRDREAQDGEKIFTGNFDNAHEVQQLFDPPFEARFIRLQPITYHKQIALRMDLLDCADGEVVPTTVTPSPDCNAEMGLYNGLVTDSQITTSSNRAPNTDGRFVRLNTLQTENHSGGWVAETLDEDQYVQIDFLEDRELHGVKIQGRDMAPQWITAFTVSYSNDGYEWNKIMDEYGVKVFPGNFDSNTAVVRYFPKPIRAQYLRVEPVAWENWIAMRLEVIGCYRGDIVKPGIGTTVTLLPEMRCDKPMGFENRLLPTSFIWVSSSRDSYSGADRIRLNTPSNEEGTGGWIPAPYDHKPIVLIDFGEPRNLTAILTQGLADEDRWVMTYKVMYSRDNITWDYAIDRDINKPVFRGNSDRNSVVMRAFTSTIEARYLKIIILDYHTLPALRMEVLGCFIPYEILPTPPIPEGTTELCIQSSDWISITDPVQSYFGDIEPISKIIAVAGVCNNPFEIECRTISTHKDYTRTGQTVTCDLEEGLVCENDRQTSRQCYNYEVRIKCWTCAFETTTPTLPLQYCPETPETLKPNCPVTCPYDYACDGSGCVPLTDCPCFQDGRRFYPPNIMITKDCQRCECILHGHSNCEPVQCPDCLPLQKSEMDEHCNCKCVGCPEGTITCPTTGQCVLVDRWCDGVTDCPDDEVDCPTTPPPTTITEVPTTTELPLVCTTDYLPDTDNCEVIANMFETFDGASYQYDICDHVLMEEKSSRLYSVSIHKTCSSSDFNICERYIIIEVDGIIIKIGPGIEDVTVQNNKVSPANLWLVSHRFQDFDLMKRGNFLLFKSHKYHFDVIWDSLQDVKIRVSKCLSRQILGLCGLYNGDVLDDRTMPNGQLARGNEEFGNSWSIGSLEKCLPPTCPPDTMKVAIETCEELRREPFNSSCADYVKIDNRVEACIVFMCDCLAYKVDARRSGSDVFHDFFDFGSCKCQAYESFVQTCETAKQSFVPEWRIKHDCTPECPVDLEWQDCGPGCELTCDNYRQRDEICSTECVPGCYCPPGLLRHHNRCVKPKMCQDCVCRGHGDPNYITFDGRYYSFQGNCTYVLAQHLTSDDQMNFRVLATNVECPEEPNTSCAEGVTVIWNGHTVEKFKNRPVYVDQREIKREESPLEYEGISITYVPGKSTIIYIKDIGLTVRYFDQMYGFNVELPAFFYFNQTEGLCGVCNFIKSDDLYHKDGYVTEDIQDFAYSWLEEPYARMNCEFNRVPAVPPGEITLEICNFTSSRCELFLDPEPYSASCQNDVSYSQKTHASMCRSKFQYAQQCCERGVSLVDWLKLSGCETSCSEGMLFECTSACQKTCENYDTYQEDDCAIMPLYTCTCPEGQVMKMGRCVDIAQCRVCDAVGHIVGEVWNEGPCKVCECTEDLTRSCTVTVCPEPPVCGESEVMQTLPRPANACCDAYQCVPFVPDCPKRELEDCPPGYSNMMKKVNGCQTFYCECVPEKCPTPVQPILDEGEDYRVVKKDCCKRYEVICNPDQCQPEPLCGPGFKLSKFEGRCCNKYTCVRMKNICLYQHKHDVVNGSQVDLEPEAYYSVEYELGASWQDGLCRKCSCVDNDGQYTFSCRQEKCPDPSEFPDADKYEREKIHVPGACCAKYHRVACIVNGVKYAVGEEWPSPEGDPCKSYRCITDQRGEAIRLEKTITCDKTCPSNAIYEEPAPDSGKCCGICKPFACEENGVLYQNAETWVSALKPCFTAECTVKNNGTTISYRGESCPMMPQNCPPENVVTDPKGCCTYCKVIKETCASVVVPKYESRGFFSYNDKAKGFCTNKQSLPGLTKCAGQCTTKSLYSELVGDFQSVCSCCLPHRKESRTITLTCEDGTSVEKVYEQPTSCECTSCSGSQGSQRFLDAMNRVELY